MDISWLLGIFLRDVGYEYVNVDDCWALKHRGPDGRMVPDSDRFPNGIKGLADYVHSKGLKFGLYTVNSGLGRKYHDSQVFRTSVQ